MKTATLTNLSNNQNCFKIETLKMDQTNKFRSSSSLLSKLNTLTTTQQVITNKVLFVNKNLNDTIDPNSPIE